MPGREPNSPAIWMCRKNNGLGVRRAPGRRFFNDVGFGNAKLDEFHAVVERQIQDIPFAGQKIGGQL